MTVTKHGGVEAQIVPVKLSEHAGKTVDIAAFPAGTVLTDVSFTVETAFSAGCTAGLALGSTSVISAAAVTSLVELKNAKKHKIASGNNKLSLTLGAASVGAGFVTASYILPTKTEADY